MNQNPSKLEPEAFLSVVRRSSLLTDEQLEHWLHAIKTTNSKLQSSTTLLTKDLLDKNLVTPWQAKNLLAGKYKGMVLGSYKLLEHIGSGGMSTVYLAEHRLTGHQRAIKVLPRNKLNEKSYLARFYHEAQAVASLNHPNIVRVYDVAEDAGTHYMVMEFVRGQDLSDAVQRRGMFDYPLTEKCLTLAATALAAAHSAGVIHRDIKPSNLLLMNDGQLKVLDLGLALLKSEANNFGISAQYNETTLGTVDYLAPEQAIDSHAIDQRADIYSLGCTCYYLLTGQPPFPSGTLAERIIAHQSQPLPRIHDHRPDCPAHLDSICQKMTAKDPEHRFHNCEELVAALVNQQVVSTVKTISQTEDKTPHQPETQQQPRPTVPRRKSKSAAAWIAVGLLSLLIVCLLIALYLRL